MVETFNTCTYVRRERKGGATCKWLKRVLRDGKAVSSF